MSFAALALRARAANDTARAQINNIPSKSHVIPLFITSKYEICIADKDCDYHGVAQLSVHSL